MSHFRSDFSLMDRWTAVLFGHQLEMKIALYGIDVSLLDE
jgi:hypothetical protein